MKKISLLLLLISAITFKSYSQQNEGFKSDTNKSIVDQEEAGKVENGQYTCYLFDWEIEIPSGFTITPQERLNQLDDKGHAMIDENTRSEKNIKRQAIHLISFEKDKYNIFAATYESLEGIEERSLEEHKEFVVELLKETYTGSGFKFDITKSDLKLGNHDFYKLLVHLYHSTTGQLFLTQEFYTAYINDHLFMATINYMDEYLGRILTNNFMNSFQFFSPNVSEQFLLEEIQTETDNMKSLEIPFEITVKLKTDIETSGNSEMMDLILDFEVLEVDPEFYSEKQISIAMYENRKSLIAQKFKNGGTYKFKVIRQIALMEEESGSHNMIVGFTGAYERVLE
jgi:hypothetical protein